MRKKRLDKTLLFGIGLISLINLFQYLNRGDIGGGLVVILGIILILHYLWKKEIKISLLYVWILIQTPILITSSFIYAPTTHPVDISFGLMTNVFELKLNIIPIFFFSLYKWTQMNALVGQNFEIKSLNTKKESVLNKVLPITTEAVELLNVKNDKDKWIKLKIDKPITLNGVSFNFFLVKSKDGKVFNKKSFLPSYIKVGNSDKTLIIKDWVLVKKMTK